MRDSIKIAKCTNPECLAQGCQKGYESEDGKLSNDKATIEYAQTSRCTFCESKLEVADMDISDLGD